MAVNVAYEGISLAEGVLVRPSELGLFLPLPAPMPVGSRLLLERGGQGRQKVRVTRVREGAEPGVYIVAEGAIVFGLVEEPAASSEVPHAPHAPHPVEPELTVPSPPPALVTSAAVEVTAPRVPSAPHAVAAENTVPEVMEMDADEPTIVIETQAASSVAPVPVVEAAADGDGDGDEDDTVVTVTNGTERPDANGDRGAKKGRRGKRGGGKR